MVKRRKKDGEEIEIKVEFVEVIMYKYFHRRAVANGLYEAATFHLILALDFTEGSQTALPLDQKKKSHPSTPVQSSPVQFQGTTGTRMS